MFRWWKLRKIEPDLGSSELETRRRAVKALGELGGERAIELLVRTAREEKDLREAALLALRKLDDKLTVELISENLGPGKNDDVKLPAVELLVDLGDRRAVRYLVRELEDLAYPHTLGKIVELVVRMKDPAIEDAVLKLADPRFLAETRERRSRGHRGFGITAQGAMGAQARSDQSLRHTVIRALGDLGGERAKKVLEAASAEKDNYIAFAAKAALEKLG